MFYSHFIKINVYQISSIHYIFYDILFFLSYSILSSTELNIENLIYSHLYDENISDFQCSLYLCKKFIYYFCYILFNMELVKKNKYQIFNVNYTVEAGYIAVRYIAESDIKRALSCLPNIS
jgi:hypothetical protein